MTGSREDQSGLALFAAELHAAREKAGVSQDELGARVNYSASLVAMVESRRRAPSLDFAQRCDEEFATSGTFARLQQHARTAPLPAWFRPYADIEATATQLRLFEHSLLPGLLQTENYARAVLATLPKTTEAEVDDLVAARMERQAILDRAGPPLLWVVIDEAVLHRQSADAKITHDQFLHLADMSERPSVNVQVLPYSAGAHYALLGAFAIADVDDAARVGYLETAYEGYIVESRAAISRLMLMFDNLRSEALPRAASRDLILKWAGEYDRPE
ncbi:MAG: helix-turn-helix domain-containing protein [Streptosporangiaceae bacterium]